jgi:hypothetical protein
MGEEHLDPPWAFGPGGERFEVEVTGDPGTLVTFKKLHPESIAAGLERNPGIVATALHCVNAVPYVVAARPGLLTYLDLPPVAGRAAADLHRDRRDDGGPGDRPGPRSKRLAGAYFATYGAPPTQRSQTPSPCWRAWPTPMPSAETVVSRSTGAPLLPTSTPTMSAGLPTSHSQSSMRSPTTSPTGQTRSNQETSTMNPREMRLGCLHRSQSPANETIWMAPAGRSRGRTAAHTARDDSSDRLGPPPKR